MKRHRDYTLNGRKFTYRDWLRKLRQIYRNLNDSESARDHKLQACWAYSGRRAWVQRGGKHAPVAPSHKSD